jgi:hypothetical protein
MARDELSCRTFEEDIIRSIGLLRERDIVEASLSDEMVKSSLRRCKSCKKGVSGKRCSGWLIELLHNKAIHFVPTRHKEGSWLRGVVTGRFRAEVSQKDRLRHVEATCAIEVWKISEKTWMLEEDGPCTRHHLDLANPGQDGPAWHLQSGGLHSNRGSMPYEWLDVPRWPSLPMNLILVMELAVYSLFPEKWQELRTTSPWRDIVKRSELLMMADYRAHLNGYFNQHSREDPEHASWLSFQCNRTGGWDSHRP